MKVDGWPYRTIWLNQDGSSVDVIDQRWLPHEFKVATLRSVAEAATAIRDMWVRGAPLIGATAAYGLALAVREVSVCAHFRPVRALHDARACVFSQRSCC